MKRYRGGKNCDDCDAIEQGNISVGHMRGIKMEKETKLYNVSVHGGNYSFVVKARSTGEAKRAILKEMDNRRIEVYYSDLASMLIKFNKYNVGLVF